jgi:hypothetical protein
MGSVLGEPKNMLSRRLLVSAMSLLLAVVLTVPPEAAAQAAQAQHAGQVSNVVPAVNLERGAQQMPATLRMPVEWNDVINTGRLARARLSLDDGSILNVGSESTLRVTKHDAGAQQTDLELVYGRLQIKATKLTKPGASFQVHTPTGVAGVVGTHFILVYQDFITRLITLEGSVNFCNLAGQCVTVAAGAVSIIRGNNSPSSPSPVTPADLTDAETTTSIGPTSGLSAAIAGHTTLFASALGLAVAVPAIVVRSLSRTPGCGCTGTTTGSGGNGQGGATHRGGSHH